MKNYIVIAAGGSGRRVGGNIAKQFLMLKGEPVLLRTMEAFADLSFETEMIIILPSSDIPYWKEYCNGHDVMIRHTIVAGGISRYHSVKNALEYVPDDCLVAIHDGVRPFVPSKMIEKMFTLMKTESASGYAGAIPVIQTVDSLRKVSRDSLGRISESFAADRKDYVSVQTPQVFDSSILKRCYEKSYSPLFTDDASVVEYSGYKLLTYPGCRLNFKITLPEDLIIAEALSDNFPPNALY
ncbi:MAG: 2-C-methyl-D-erythritol 4-phosphate cytidylyltransferase [Bacteroidales bacterium]|jgi:2-C-methyl-D-erythritol 4-phosphate cytidylyltransferase|nr:2-C-methyl-D-erythritol 4-phosphate cytidylyltransferase [Bacteroidales bacterium]